MIRKILIAAAAVLLSVAVSDAQYRYDSGYAGLFDSETVTSLKNHVKYITATQFEGRKAGSEGEKAVAGYVAEKLKAYGVEMLSPEGGDEFGIVESETDTLTSRNVYGFIQGYDPAYAGKYIVVGARLDNLGVQEMTVDGRKVSNIYAGANGNASGLGMMIELARLVSVNKIMFRRSVLFVGFGASARTFAGSWYFLNRSFSDAGRIDAMINLDMVGTGSRGFYAYTSSNTDLNAILNTLSGELQPVLPELRADEPYPSDHRAFYAKEIPSVFFTTGQYPEHNTFKDVETLLDYDIMEKELEYVYNFTLAVANTDKELAFRNSLEPEQDPSYEDVVPYYDCDYRPMFLNSADPAQFMNKWVYQYLKYPPQAVKDGIQGTVNVSFIIDKDGKVQNVRVTRSVDPLLDAEAVRVVEASPKWRPGRLRGEKVRTSMTIPVEFRLEKKSSRPKFGIR